MKDTGIRLTGSKIQGTSYIQTLSTFSKLGPTSLIIIILIFNRKKLLTSGFVSYLQILLLQLQNQHFSKLGPTSLIIIISLFLSLVFIGFWTENLACKGFLILGLQDLVN